MHSSTKMLITALTATAIFFGGSCACGIYSANEEINFPAIILSFILLVPAIGCGIWSFTAFVQFLRRRDYPD